MVTQPDGTIFGGACQPEQLFAERSLRARNAHILLVLSGLAAAVPRLLAELSRFVEGTFALKTFIVKI
jgi:hypothetical protein